jgi:hypothetical protein
VGQPRWPNDPPLACSPRTIRGAGRGPSVQQTLFLRRHFIADRPDAASQPHAVAPRGHTTRFFTIVISHAPPAPDKGSPGGNSRPLPRRKAPAVTGSGGAPPVGETAFRLSRGESCAVTGGGGDRARTGDLLLAKQALSQAELHPRARDQGSGARITLPGSWLLIPEWWAREDLNLRPHAYQARALTS